MKTRDPEHFDKIAGHRWCSYLLELERRAICMAASIVAWPPTRCAAIDIGAGTGRWSRLLADRGWDVTCIDVDQTALEVLQKKIPGATVVQVDKDTTFVPVVGPAADLVLCIEVAPVIESPWLAGELRRLLRVNGLFVGVHVNRASWRGLAVRLKYWLTGDWRKGVYYTSSYQDWRSKWIKSGFEFIHEEGYAWGPFSRESNNPLVTPFVWLERAMQLRRLVRFSPWVLFIARKK